MAFKSSFDPKTGRIKFLVRLSYCKIFEKTASVQGGKLAYRTNGLIDKSSEEGKLSIVAVNEAIKAMVEKEWPGKELKGFVKALKDRAPLFDGDEYVTEDGEVRDGYKNQRFVKLVSDRKIKLRSRNGQELDEDEAKELFVSGHWAIAYGHLYAIKDKAKGGNGIFMTVDGLQFYKRDEQFAGGGMDDDEFDDLGDEDGDDLGDDDEDDDLDL